MATFEVDELSLWTQKLAERALLTKLVMVGKVKTKGDFVQEMADAVVPLVVPGVKRARVDLSQTVETLNLECVLGKNALTDSRLQGLQLCSAGSSSGPAASVNMLAGAVADGRIGQQDLKASVV